MATIEQQLEFVKQVYPAANSLYKKGGIHPLFVIAQAALETGWKIGGIKNNIFGITKGSWTGSTQLALTKEVFSTPDKKFIYPEEVVSVKPLKRGGYQYVVWRLFRVYASIEDCLNDHLDILKKPMYKDAWPHRDNPKEFARRIVDEMGAKYATDPSYYKTMVQMINMVEKHVKTLNI